MDAGGGGAAGPGGTGAAGAGAGGVASPSGGGGGERGPRPAGRVLVFGGSGALGGEVCRVLAAEGARVALTYRKGEAAALELARTLPGALALPLDLHGLADIDRTVDRAVSEFAGLDAFVQCAGTSTTMECSGPAANHRMPQVDEGAFDEMIDVNVKSTFFAIRRLVEVFRAGGGGNVVLIGSVDAVKPAHTPVHFAAAKGALRGMVLAMAKELGEFGVRVNLVAPGVLEAGASRTLPAELMQEYLKHCGLRRLGRMSEAANLVAWLALRNTYVTGQTVLLDGGL